LVVGDNVCVSRSGRASENRRDGQALRGLLALPPSSMGVVVYVVFEYLRKDSK
jgi:hypothetical protein